MLKILLTCTLLVGTTLFVWWFSSGEFTFDHKETDVVDADAKVEEQAKVKKPKTKSKAKVIAEPENESPAAQEKTPQQIKEISPKETDTNAPAEEPNTETKIDETQKEVIADVDHDDSDNAKQPTKPSLEAFNVEVKDLDVSGKNIRISHFDGVGVISINLCFKHAGKKLSPVGKESLVSLLSRALGEGTKLKDRDQLEAYARKENVSISFAGLDDHFFIHAKCPSNKLKELFALLNELLFQAKFEKADLERFKEEIAADLLQSMQSPETVLNELIKDTIYKKHPYGVMNKTYIESFKNIFEADLQKFIKDNFTQQNLFVSVCGEFEEDSLSEQIDGFIKALPKNFKHDLPKKIVVNGPYELYKQEFPVPQTVIKFLHEGIDHNHPDFFALQVAIGCLSDPFLGLLFKKVRVEKALTYGIGAGLAIQEHFNAFGISTFTQTENVDKVIETVKDVLKDVDTNGFPEELVQTIKKSFIGNYKRSFASSGQIANRLTNYQLIDRPVDYHKVLIEQISALTPEQVNEAFKKFIHPDNLMIFTVGQ